MKNQKVRFPLSRKIALLIVAVVLTSSLFIFAVSYKLYAGKMNSFYEDYLLAVSDIMAGYFTREEAEEWFEEDLTAEQLEEYESMCIQLSSFASHFGLSRLSVVRSEEGGVRYVIDISLDKDSAVYLAIR